MVGRIKPKADLAQNKYMELKRRGTA